MTVDAQRNTAQMAILGEDRHTVFGSFGFTFLLTNGVVLPDHLQFVTNVIEASTDLFNWTAIRTNVFPVTACPGCPFIEFQDPASTNLAGRFYRSYSLP